MTVVEGFGWIVVGCCRSSFFSGIIFSSDGNSFSNVSLISTDLFATNFSAVAAAARGDEIVAVAFTAPNVQSIVQNTYQFRATRTNITSGPLVFTATPVSLAGVLSLRPAILVDGLKFLPRTSVNPAVFLARSFAIGETYFNRQITTNSSGGDWARIFAIDRMSKAIRGSDLSFVSSNLQAQVVGTLAIPFNTTVVWNASFSVVAPFDSLELRDRSSGMFCIVFS